MTRQLVRITSAAAGFAVVLLGAPAAFAQADTEITKFKYEAPQTALDDLKERLKRTRWPDRETVKDWSQGVPLDKLKPLVEYWRTDYDWRRGERSEEHTSELQSLRHLVCR